MSFSEKLKELRKEKGLTQEELAKEIFVSRTLISKYENGAIYPTKENAIKIAEFFGSPIFCGVFTGFCINSLFL